MADWQSTYRERFLERAIQRPSPPPVYNRLTDDQIACLPEAIQPYLRMQRAVADAVGPIVSALSRVQVPSGWELRRG